MRHYFRKGGKRVPLDAPGTSTFSERYDDLLTEHAPHVLTQQKKNVPPAEWTLSWLIDRYKETAVWKALAPSSREVYGRLFDWLKENYGTGDIRTLKEKHVRTMRNALKDRPSVADHTVSKVGTLWKFAKEELELELGPNPAREVASIHTVKQPHQAWPEDLCAKIEAHPNPRIVRAYFLLRYSGQRRGDVAAMQRSHFDGTAIRVIQEKTGTPCWIPAHKKLRDHLDATGIEGDYLLLSMKGDRFKATSVTNMICEACAQAGYPGFSPHGLRHLAGASLAEAGCSTQEIMAILGHLTERQAAHYVRQARRKVMAGSAIKKWELANDA
jgi:integrase